MSKLELEKVELQRLEIKSLRSRVKELEIAVDWIKEHFKITDQVDEQIEVLMLKDRMQEVQNDLGE